MSAFTLSVMPPECGHGSVHLLPQRRCTRHSKSWRHPAGLGSWWPIDDEITDETLIQQVVLKLEDFRIVLKRGQKP